MPAFPLPALAVARRSLVRRHRTLTGRTASRYGPQAGTTTAE